MVAVGGGANKIAYSSDGINWTPVSSSPFTTAGFGVAWNGTQWVAVGEGTNTIAYSSDGIIWTGIGNSIITTAGLGVASNSLVGTPIVESQLVLNANGFGLNSTLDIISEKYNNNGYENFSVKIKSELL